MGVCVLFLGTNMDICVFFVSPEAADVAAFTNLNKLGESQIHLHEDVLPGLTHAGEGQVQVLQEGGDVGELARHPGHLGQAV